MNAPINFHFHQFQRQDKGIISLMFKDLLELGDQTDQKLTNLSKGQYFTVGIHPWEVEQLNGSIKNNISLVNRFRSHRACLGIGEIGLDKGPRFKSSFDRQLDYFRALVDNCKNDHASLIVIHNVKSFEQIALELRRLKHDFIVYWHDFNGNLNQVERLKKEAWKNYFGLGPALFRQKPKVLAVLEKVSLEQILLETDDLDRTIDEVYQAMAKRFDLSFDYLVKKMTANFEQLLTFVKPSEIS
jgi:Tat protein secretion system quality control protein TatD with DNase activity